MIHSKYKLDKKHIQINIIMCLLTVQLLNIKKKDTLKQRRLDCWAGWTHCAIHELNKTI